MQPPAQSSAPWRTTVVIAAGFFFLAAVATWPLLRDLHIRIASDPGDPILSATVLWWNATTVPFSAAWWSPPYFAPHAGMSALTENMVGVSLVASPVFWLTHDPVAAYNIGLFLTWPLSALAVYALVRAIARRTDAAIIAGVAFAFGPYRAAQLSHIQVMSAYWLPVALLALHRFLEQGRRRWLVLFGVTWLMQALANGYLLFFGGVLVALWILYFCSARVRWRAGVEIVATWIVATVPLVPILLRYRTIHEQYGLGRGLFEIVALSAQPQSWLQVSNLTWLWPHVLDDRGTESDLFPGLTGLALVALAGWAYVRTRPLLVPSHERAATVAQRVCAALAAACALAAIVTLVIGPWRLDVAGVRISIGGVGRAVALALAFALGALALAARARRIFSGRPALAFYVLATAALALLACGPELRMGAEVLLQPAPYRWLMRIPGVAELRVPARLWLTGTLSLAVASGLAFARLSWGARSSLAAAVVVAALVAEGWMPVMPMAPVPETWAVVEPASRTNAILELPLGPDFDAAATFRSLVHRRPVVNGVSGYEPPAYIVLERGLDARDPEMLAAITSIGAIDVIVDRAHDPDGSLLRMVMASPDAERVADDGVRVAYQLPATTRSRAVRATWPVASASASVHEERARLAIDGVIDTWWRVDRQEPGQWIAADLGMARDVAGIELAVGEDATAFPRALSVELSLDGQEWRTAWQGSAIAPALFGALDRPREIPVRVEFAPKSGRFVRLRQTASNPAGWAVAELRVLAASPAPPGTGRDD